MGKEKAAGIETTTLKRVQANEKKGWVSVMLVQLGCMVCVPSLMLGGLLSSAMPTYQAILSSVVGFIIVNVLISLCGIVGCEVGVPSSVVAKACFGEKGARFVIGALWTVIAIGWFAVSNRVCGFAFVEFVNSKFDINFPPSASIAFWGIIMLLTAVWGFNAIEKLNVIATPALLIVSVIGCVILFNHYGISGLSNEAEETTMTFMEGVCLTISFSSFAIGAAPDFTRYQKNRKDTILANSLGIGGVGFCMMLLGLILTKMTGEYDISLVFMAVGIPMLGLIVLVLATWTTNTANAYSGGINIVMFLGLKDEKRSTATLIAGIIATIVALTGVTDNFEGFLNFSGNALLPLTGVITADFWIRRKANADNWSYRTGWDFIGFASVIIGTAIAIIIPYGAPVIQGYLSAGLAYLILKYIEKKVLKEKIPEEIRPEMEI